MFSTFKFVNMQGHPEEIPIRDGRMYEVYPNIRNSRNYQLNNAHAFAVFLAGLLANGVDSGLYRNAAFPGVVLPVDRVKLEQELVTAEEEAERLRKEWIRTVRQGGSLTYNSAAQAMEEARDDVMLIGGLLDGLDGDQEASEVIHLILTDVQRFNFDPHTKIDPQAVRHIPFLQGIVEPDYGDFLGGFMPAHAERTAHPMERISVW